GRRRSRAHRCGNSSRGRRTSAGGAESRATKRPGRGTSRIPDTRSFGYPGRRHQSAGKDCAGHRCRQAGFRQRSGQSGGRRCFREFGFPSGRSGVAPAAAPAAALTATAAASVAVPLSGLALEIAASAKNGKSSFEIRLDPAELGRIDVRIDVDRNGQMTSHLTVEKPETLSMLQQDAPQLQRALDNAGFRTGDGGLQFSLRDQSSGGNGGNTAVPNAQRLIITDDDAIPAAVAGRTYGRMPGSGSGVDIRV